MPPFPSSSFLQLLRDRITLGHVVSDEIDPRFQRALTDNQRISFSGIPFSERGSPILLFRRGSILYILLAERWAKWAEKVGDYRHRAPVVQDLILMDGDGVLLDFAGEII